MTLDDKCLKCTFNASHLFLKVLNKRAAIIYVQLQFYYWVRHLSTAAHKKELKSFKKLLKNYEKFQNSAKNLKH